MAASRPCRQPRPLRAFRAARVAIDAALRASGNTPLGIEQFVAARLYTGPMFVKYNGVLRGIQPQSPAFFAETWRRLCLGNCYTATIHTINAALVKLSAVERVTKVYRGVAGVARWCQSPPSLPHFDTLRMPPGQANCQPHYERRTSVLRERRVPHSCVSPLGAHPPERHPPAWLQVRCARWSRAGLHVYD